MSTINNDGLAVTVTLHDIPDDHTGAVVSVICGTVIGSIIRSTWIDDGRVVAAHEAHIDIVDHDTAVRVADVQIDDPMTLRRIAAVASILAEQTGAGDRSEPDVIRPGARGRRPPLDHAGHRGGASRVIPADGTELAAFREEFAGTGNRLLVRTRGDGLPGVELVIYSSPRDYATFVVEPGAAYVLAAVLGRTGRLASPPPSVLAL